MSENIKERLLKVKKLAESGSPGEREAAQALFDRLVKKYGLEDFNFDEEVIGEYDFYFKGVLERRLLLQVYYKVTNSDRMFWLRDNQTHRRKTSVLRGECTQAQKVEVDFLFDFYKTLFWDEVNLLFKAFIYKHHLFGVPNEDEEDDRPEMDPEEFIRMTTLARGLKDSSPTLRIEGGSDDKQ